MLLSNADQRSTTLPVTWRNFVMLYFWNDFNYDMRNPGQIFDFRFWYISDTDIFIL